MILLGSTGVLISNHYAETEENLVFF